METLEKLRYLIDNKMVSRYKLAQDTGISKTTLTNYYEGNTVPNAPTLDYIEKYISRNYSCFTDKTMRPQGTVHYESMRGTAIPHIDIATASCGMPNGFTSAIMKTDCERYIIPDMAGCDFTIRANGRSMMNRNIPERSIQDRDIVGCRIITSRSHVKWGEVYALATCDGLVIKRIEESEKEGCVKCVSFNVEEGYKPYDIPVNEIYDWAIVVGVVSVKAWV